LYRTASGDPPAVTRAPRDDLGILLGFAYQVFVEQLDARLAQRGFADLRPGFGYVFRALAERPLTATQLASQLGVTPQAAGKLVHQMLDAGYLERQPDPHDERLRWLALAPRGRRAFETAREIHQALEQRLADAVGAEHVAILRAVLTAFIEHESAPTAAARTLRLP
jgi:MarR family transcriptional regulator for hemolysin